MFFFRVLLRIVMFIVIIFTSIVILWTIGTFRTNERIGNTGLYFTQDEDTFTSILCGKKIGDKHPELIIELSGEALYNDNYLCTCGYYMKKPNSFIYHIIELTGRGYYQHIYSYENNTDYKKGLDSLSIDVLDMKHLKYKHYGTTSHIKISPYVL